VHRGPIALSAQAVDALAEPADVAGHLGAARAHLFRQVVDEDVGQRGDAPDDHLFRVALPLVAALGVERHRLPRRWQIPLAGDHLGHGRAPVQGHGRQQRLADPMQPAPGKDPLLTSFKGGGSGPGPRGGTHRPKRRRQKGPA